MSDRVFAVVLLLLAAGYAWVAWQIEVPFQYEPLGPKPWPLLLAALLAVCALVVLVRPGREPGWPRGVEMRRSLLLLLLLVLYALLFQPLGYMITTFVVCAGLAFMLGAGLLYALGFGLLVAVPGFFLFTDVLKLNLPWGEVFR
ncbi:MAG: tripartite tricarboxylate transporter TctB family protein [Geminicoccaceae bacterium]|nr:tripartite tricarboxylate transporter TctB family protein [Geminicoccaceae bacterium]